MPRWWKLRRELVVLWRAFMSRRTPWTVRALVLLALVYAVSPLDLVPDWIPFAGWLDDLVIVPLILSWASRVIPPDLKADLARS